MAKKKVEIEEVEEYDESDEFHDSLIDLAIEGLGDDVIDAIRADERQMIIDFISREENLYEVGEDLIVMIDDLEHYDSEEIH
jgi:hypothetical protein